MLALIPQSSLHSNDLYNEIYNAPLQHSDPIPLHQGVHDVATLFMQGGPGFNDLLTPTYVYDDTQMSGLQLQLLHVYIDLIQGVELQG